MRYTVETTINRPIQQVIELFDNQDLLKEWQPGLQSYTPVSGTPGQVGAKSKLVYVTGKRSIEMVETITVRNLPSEMTFTFEANGVFNIVKNYFTKIDEHTTRYATEQEFQFKGFMKVIGMLFPNMFKKESAKSLEQFKAFVEKQPTA